ncbi:MAG: zonular occludens toxin domain-containing protein [Candidatus Coproplasma sp.]
MIHEVFGDCKVGKTAFLTYQIKNLYLNHGDEILSFSKSIIAEENAKRQKKLSYPRKPPIYTNFDVTITKPDGTVFKPYRIVGNEIGLNEFNPEGNYKYFYPAAHIFIDEAQCYFDSKGGELKRAISAFFEMHGHYDLDIWLAAQRGILIDKNIRNIAKDFKLIKELTHETSVFGNVTKSFWRVWEFTDKCEFEKFLASDGSEGEHNEKFYVDNGNILDCYNSRCYRTKYLPPEGKNF